MLFSFIKLLFMRKIHGRILVKETNAPIPNLVVAAFDSELRLPNIKDGGKDNFRITAQFIQQLGKRIGSVITDKLGNFLLGHTDLQFEGVESRPDLILVVFAPEDTLDDLHPFPLPPEKRVLYISTVPRDDAGSEEAYMIRLRQKQLEKFQIAIGVISAENETDSLQLLNAIERSYALTDKMQEKLSPRIRFHLEKATELKKEVKEKFSNFSTLRSSLRDHPLFISDKKSLPQVHKTVINDGLSRLKDYQGSLQLSLTTEQLKSIGLETSDNGKIKGEVKSAALLELMKKLSTESGDLDLIRVREAGDKSAEELWNKYTKKNEDVVDVD